VSHWLWRLRRLLAVLIAAVLVTTEIQFVATVHSGVGVGAASDPFQARFIATNLAMALGLYLVGCWWVRRPRPPVLRNLVKSGSDNSFGVYLCHGVALNLLIHWGYGARLEAHMRWEYAALIAVVIVWTAAATFCAAVARTPLAPAVGRARRPLWHGPARGRAEPAEPLGAVA
jgi:peptidoglycan/LPS O-acetylase OafA/YrhL